MLIFGVSFDGVAANKAFAEKFSFAYPLLCDPDRKVGLAYEACDDATATYAKRITYVVGPDGKIESAVETKDPAGQADALLKTLA